MRVAIVHHWLVTQGGGERVLEALASLYPAADIFTLLAVPGRIPASLQHRQITQSFLAWIPGSRRLHRHLLPLYPLAVEQLDLRGYDLVISSDAGPMKGVILAPGAVHICYCHAPMRYLWNQFHEYREELGWPLRAAFSLSAHYVRSWDFAAAQRVTLFVANSANVSRRIRQYYARSSVVLYPPVETAQGTIAEDPGSSYLAVGRLVSYKRMDLVIAACNRLRRPLRIIGSGPEERGLRAMAGPTIKFLGQVPDTTLWQEYRRCRAFLFAAEEDFGIAPLEAQACGRPVVAFGKGGALESVLPVNEAGVKGSATGVFFLEQSERALCDAILEFEQKEDEFASEFIRTWATRFNAERFSQGFRELANGAMKSRQRIAVDGYSSVAPVIDMQERGAH